MEERDSYLAQHYPQITIPTTPPGLEAIYAACRKLYPNQPNPLQVTALVKYWLGGPDPLDYISMYANPGDPEQNIPPHWHYISFGLSDLHGDGRVHDCQNIGPDTPSGWGFELTMRLKRDNDETAPPTWPAALMQCLARYVFKSENTLCPGDHIPWHSPLDGSESRVQHILMTEDPQLLGLTTPFGKVNFVQIVGVCAEELKAAQHWNGTGVLELLKTVPMAGGSWLITDMRRGESIFELDPQIQDKVDQGIEQEGSNLSGISSKVNWEEPNDSVGRPSSEEDKTSSLVDGDRRFSNELDQRPHLSQLESQQIKEALTMGLSHSRESERLGTNPDCEHNANGSRKESFDSCVSSEAPTELMRTRTLDSVHLTFNMEAGSLLPLALRGRLKHGRHFTIKSVLNDVAVTFVSTCVIGAIVEEQHPFGAHGPWLQVLFTDDFIELLTRDLAELSSPDEIQLPKTYKWPHKHFAITIVPDDV